MNTILRAFDEGSPARSRKPQPFNEKAQTVDRWAEMQTAHHTRNTKCEPFIRNATESENRCSDMSELQQSRSDTDSCTKGEPLVRNDVESTNRPAEMLSTRVDQHGARNRNRPSEM